MEQPRGSPSLSWEDSLRVFPASLGQRSQTRQPWGGGAELLLQQEEAWTELGPFGKGFKSTREQLEVGAASAATQGL